MQHTLTTTVKKISEIGEAKRQRTKIVSVKSQIGGNLSAGFIHSLFSPHMQQNRAQEMGKRVPHEWQNLAKMASPPPSLPFAPLEEKGIISGPFGSEYRIK